MKNKVYSFSTDDAIKHGVDQAILLHNIRYWLDHARANEQMEQDGYYWMFMSANKMQSIMPFWSQEKIRRMLKSLEDDGAVITGEYNKSSWDRTKWYSMPEFHSTKLPHRVGENDDSTFHKIATSHYSKKEDSNINTSDSRFNEFWDLYGKKVDTKKCKSKFDKLSKASQDKIFDVLPDYIASTPDKQFRKLPMTWLNGECWNDEIQKPLTLTNECGINLDLLVENFNKSMMIWSGVPEVIKITDKQKDMICILERYFAMTDERFAKYFNHIATSDKFKYFVDGINMPAQNLTYFLKEDTIQK